MVTKHSRMMTYRQLAPKKLKKLWPSGLARSLDKLNHRISTTIRYMVTKLRRMVTFYERLSPIKSHNPSIMWSSEIKWQTKPIISTLAMPADTRVVGRWLTLRRSHTYSNMVFWSREHCEVTWKFEKSISPLSQDLWPLNLTGCWLQGGAAESKHLISPPTSSTPKS